MTTIHAKRRGLGLLALLGFVAVGSPIGAPGVARAQEGRPATTRNNPAPRGTAPTPAVAPMLGGLGVPVDPKVLIRWDAFHDVAGLATALQAIARAHPERARTSTIGQSYEGRDIHLITITNFATGDDRQKPAMWIDANIHGNEIQGSEVALYTAWYLTEMYGKVPAVTELLDRVTFYIAPSINPDGRDHFFADPNNMHSSRGGRKPYDSDGDGLFDEDGPDDLDGDGNICEMRIKDPHGRMRINPDDPKRMIPARPDEPGQYTSLDDEGIDNDGDGRVNEDGPGGYDPNRNWPALWQPDYVQFGAIDYPGSLPETRAVLDFAFDHPNIAGVQTYHNAAGMILRGPGQESAPFQSQDVAVFDIIGLAGQEMLPGYRYLTLWKDLYPVWGGEIDWWYVSRGIITFSNELWTAYNYFRDAEAGDGDFDGDPSSRFDKLLLLGEATVDWKPYDHPTYGRIEIGGVRKNFGRVPPGFLLQEECHRNMAFTLYHAMQMPKPAIDEPVVTPLAGGLKRVQVTVANGTVIPTRTVQDVNNRISTPDLATLSGGVTVLSGGVAAGRFDTRVNLQPATGRPAEIRVERLPGMGTVTLEWIVQGAGDATVTYRAAKGGSVSRTFRVGG